MKDLDIKIGKDINKLLDKHIKQYNKVIDVVKQAKKEITDRKGEIFQIIKLFEKYGIEVCGYDVSAFKRAPVTYNGITSEPEDIIPYSTIIFNIKHPDNDVILNIRARYNKRVGQYHLKNDPKTYSYEYRFYELEYSFDTYELGKMFVNKNSARANIIKNCVYSIGKTKGFYHTSQSIRLKSDKEDMDCFFYNLNAILSIKNSDDARRFKECTAKAIMHNCDLLSDLDKFEGDSKDPYAKMHAIEKEEWSESYASR